MIATDELVGTSGPDAAGAAAALRAATALEPRDFVTWGLRGDLALRRGDAVAARAAYRRASALNPLDRTLRGLARDPAAAAGQSRVTIAN
ncbi:MAG: hypothetical protein GXY03_02160 [Solirubrobacterales bacterium]|nr:hypothetical protein [Solirubrobacterales bacterium]